MKVRTTSFLIACLVMTAVAAPASGFDTLNFVGAELLTRPTDHSVVISVVPRTQLEVRYEYGTDTFYGNLTSSETTTANVPETTVIMGLLPDTRYHYRMRYRELASGDSLAGPGRTFHTQRVPGEPYAFAIEADPHMLPTGGDSALAFEMTLQNIAAANPDFLIDMGDNDMLDKISGVNSDTIVTRMLMYRNWWGAVCHSAPLFMTLGNHEGEQGWDIDSTPTSYPVLFTNARKLYFPNPVPDAFYTGDSVAEEYVGLRENYYAWQWGNALFVVLDPYWYTGVKPHSGDENWDWTLGQAQYDWFTQVLEQSSAKFKFVFIHQLVGGRIDSTSRGGIEYCHFYEMGGLNSDSTWGFDTHRPGWALPLHQLMIANGVDILFKGHDHLYARQDTDGLIYQTLPQPGRAQWESIPRQAAQYNYRSGILLGSRGYLRVTMNDTSAAIDYIRTFLPGETTQTHRNGMVAYSYTIVKSGPTGLAGPASFRSPVAFDRIAPSPFRQAVSIGYTLSAPGETRLEIYDAAGERIRTLVRGRAASGRHEVRWDGTSDRGRRSPAAVYFARLETEAGAVTRQLVLQ